VLISLLVILAQALAAPESMPSPSPVSSRIGPSEDRTTLGRACDAKDNEACMRLA
jgi:hypothetical protein